MAKEFSVNIFERFKVAAVLGALHAHLSLHSHSELINLSLLLNSNAKLLILLGTIEVQRSVLVDVRKNEHDLKSI